MYKYILLRITCCWHQILEELNGVGFVETTTKKKKGIVQSIFGVFQHVTFTLFG